MKSSRSKQAKAREFSEEARLEIWQRDRGKCIFCEMGYHMEDTDSFGRSILQIMHYIPRSANGLGIPQNGAIGCQSHHNMLDNGNQGRRQEMLDMFKKRLKDYYSDWSEEDLVYSKWKDLERRR